MGTHQQWKSRSLAPFLSLCFSKDLCIAMVKTSHQFPRTTLVISQFQWTDVDWELLWNNSDCMRNFSMEGIQLSGLAICWCYHGVSTENWKESYLEQWLFFFFLFSLIVPCCLLHFFQGFWGLFPSGLYKTLKDMSLLFYLNSDMQQWHNATDIVQTSHNVITTSRDLLQLVRSFHKGSFS